MRSRGVRTKRYPGHFLRHCSLPDHRTLEQAESRIRPIAIFVVVPFVTDIREGGMQKGGSHGGFLNGHSLQTGAELLGEFIGSTRALDCILLQRAVQHLLHKGKDRGVAQSAQDVECGQWQTVAPTHGRRRTAGGRSAART